MKFLEFPHVVVRIILKQMCYGNLFIFSLISKRSLQLVRSVGWKEIKRIRYSIDGKIVRIMAKNHEGVFKEFIKLYPRGNRERERKTVDIDISGTKVETWRTWMISDTNPTVFYFDRPWSHSNCQMIHDQMNEMFGKHVRYTLRDFEFYSDCFLPKFIKFKETILFTPDNVDVSVLEEYFEFHPTQDQVKIHFRRISGNLSAECKLYDALTLFVSFSSWRTLDFLNRFRGKTLCLLTAQYEDEHVIEVLSKWKSQNEFGNLERLEIELSSENRFSLDTIKSGVKVEKLPNSINEQVITLSEREPYHYRKTEITEIQTSSYIVRDDGIVAFIAVTDYVIAFVVQKITEETMLNGKNGSLTL